MRHWLLLHRVGSSKVCNPSRQVDGLYTSRECKVLVFLRVWSSYSHSLCILSADDSGRLLQNPREASKIVSGQHVQMGDAQSRRKRNVTQEWPYKWAHESAHKSAHESTHEVDFLWFSPQEQLPRNVPERCPRKCPRKCTLKWSGFTCSVFTCSVPQPRQGMRVKRPGPQKD